MFNFNLSDLVTVIVPVYNHELYVHSALNSIYKQTYTNIELIVIDDQSKDSSFSKVIEWAEDIDIRKRFSKIIILKNNINIGAHATINKGIQISSGNIIFILNSDDIFIPSRIEGMLKEMSISNSGFSFSKVFPIDEYGKTIAENNLPNILTSAFRSADQVRMLYPSLGFGFLQSNIAISTGNFAIHKNLFKKIGLFRSLKYMHDWDFALRAVLETEPVYVDTPLYGYRIHGTNSFSQLENVKDIEIETIYSYLTEQIQKNNVTNELAPTPYNWPYIFELFVSNFYLFGWNKFAKDKAKEFNEKCRFTVID